MTSMELLPGEKDLLLCAARAAAGRVDARLTNAIVSCRLDWGRVIEAARRHGMLPLLHRHIEETAPLAASPEAVAELKKLAASQQLRGTMMTAELLGVLAALREAGVRAIAYKGPAMAADLYGDTTLRTCDDLDLLIRWVDLPRAAEALSREGFAPEPRLSPACLRVLPRSECDLLMARTDPRLHVELHWDILPGWMGVKADPDGIIGRARDIDCDGRGVPVPCPEDLLLCLCVDGTKDGWRKLERVAAVAVLCARKPSLDWTAVEHRALDWGVSRMLLLGLNMARQLLESDFPDRLKSAIGADRKARRATREAVRSMFDAPAAGGEERRRVAFRFATLGSHTTRARHLGMRALTPTFADVEFLNHADLPPAAYAAIRPVRLLARAASGAVHRLAAKWGR